MFGFTITRRGAEHRRRRHGHRVWASPRPGPAVLTRELPIPQSPLAAAIPACRKPSIAGPSFGPSRRSTRALTRMRSSCVTSSPRGTRSWTSTGSTSHDPGVQAGRSPVGLDILGRVVVSLPSSRRTNPPLR